MSFNIMTLRGIEFHFAECCYAEWRDYLNIMRRYTGCHYGKCHGALENIKGRGR
jgi:hypothetical protein